MSPWGWECRERLVKQVKTKPTHKRSTKWDDVVFPGPGHYEPPKLLGGKGFSKIRRAPAYSFGLNPPILGLKPAALPRAPQFNVSGMSRKGRHTIPQGTIAEHCVPPGDRTQKPGPAAYFPKVQIKRPPAYTMRIAAKPPYEPSDMWTPSANMYCPPIPGKKYPAYTFGGPYKPEKQKNMLGPGEHDPKFNYVQPAKPAFSLGYRFRYPPKTTTPAPNTYCEKRLLYSKPSAPAPSFGIRHSEYLGKKEMHELPSHLQNISRTS